MSVAIGLDLSFTNTGMAAFDKGELASLESYGTRGRKSDTHADYVRRIRHMANHIEQWSDQFPSPGIAVIEGPSFRSRFGFPHERAGLWWAVYENLFNRGVPIATVSPPGRARYITGKGNAKKDEVLAAAVARYGTVVGNHDEADAIGMAAMGSRYLGFEVETDLPADCLQAYERVVWPDG